MKTITLKIFLFLTILFLGAFLRLKHFSLPITADGNHYLTLAKNIYNGQGFTKQYVDQYWKRIPHVGYAEDIYPPLYPWTIAIYSKFAGFAPENGKKVSFICGMAALVVIFLIGNHFSFACGIFAMFFLATNYVHIYLSCDTLRESTEVFILSTLFLTFLWALKKKHWLFWCALGIVAGLEYLVKTQGAIYFVLLVAFLLWESKNLFDKRIWLSGIFFVATILPFALQSYKNFNDPLFRVTNYYRNTPSWFSMIYEKNPPKFKDYMQKVPLKKIVFIKVKYFAKTLEYYFLWMSPLLFSLALIGLVYLKNPFALVTGLSLSATIAAYILLSGPLLLNDRYHIGMIAILMPIATTTALKISESFGKVRKLIFCLVLILTSSVSNYAEYVRRSKIQQLPDPNLKIYTWIKQNTSQDIVILSDNTCDANYYTNRKLISNPYLPGISDIVNDLNPLLNPQWLLMRSLEETQYYNATHLLSTSLEVEKVQELYPMLGLKLLYQDGEKGFFKITRKQQTIAFQAQYLKEKATKLIAPDSLKKTRSL